MKHTQTAALLLSALALAGCVTAPTVKETAKITVPPVRIERVVAKVPESILNKCQKPVKLSILFKEMKERKVSEEELVKGFIDGYTNETNCWLVKEEAVRLQRQLEANTTAK